MGMQETATRVLECLGLYIGRYPMPHTLEHHLRYLLWALDIECVLDVGANVGQYGLRLRALGYQGRIVSFEPYPRAHGLLQERVANDPKWSVVPYALGDRSGARALIAYADSSLNSFHEPSGEEPGRFPGLVINERIEVEVHRLDEVFHTLVPGEPHTFLKMDTQGSDLDVLRGAGEVMTHISALQTEVALRPIYRDMPTLRHSLEMLAQLNFDLTGVFPVARSLDQLALVECDLVALNRMARRRRF